MMQSSSSSSSSSPMSSSSPSSSLQSSSLCLVHWQYSRPVFSCVFLPVRSQVTRSFWLASESFSLVTHHPLRRTASQERMLTLKWVTLWMVVVGMEQVKAYSGKVLLVSMDGFRWDYVHRVPDLKHFPGLAASGCSVDYVDNPFATKTFPCHYTIVTGLWEETHGIVANRMYDRKRKTVFTKSSKESYWWEGGEPIWITAEKQKRNSTAVYFWPGSEAEIQGLRPSIYKAYNGSVPFEERLQTAVSWFVNDHKDFVALYFNEPDSTGHRYGPDSPEVAAKVQEMDGVLGRILAELNNKNLTDVVNVIITSDHGMTNVSMQDRLIELWAYINRSLVEMVPDDSTVTAILPKEGQEAEVLRQANQIPHVTAYRKEEIPDHFHYKHNDRIMPIIIISEEGWTLSKNVTIARWKNIKGNHGYSNDLLTMKPIFFARGPDFRKGVKSTSIRSVDIYPLLCRLLHLKAAPNNGSLANTAQFVRDSTGSATPLHSRLSDGLVWSVTLTLFVGLLV